MGVGVGVDVGIGVGVGVGVGIGVGVRVGIGVTVGRGVTVGIGVLVGIDVGTASLTNSTLTIIESVTLPDWAVTLAVPLSVKPERVTVAVPP